MPHATPFHARTAPLCKSMKWKDWAGFYSVCTYDTYPEREYFAFRHAAGLIDVSPLHKYDVRGGDAAAFLSRVMVRDIRKLNVGQITYTCWCDHDGKVLDDGTVWRLDETWYRVTAAEPNLRWLVSHARGFEATIDDVSERIAAVSLQGPRARDVLKQACQADLDTLRFFRLTPARFDGLTGIVTRTGYTGDLGYEIWVSAVDAPRLWDVLIDAGRPLGLLPAGLDAMDITRVEAGFVLNGIDYFPANRCLIEPRKSTPFELGFDWMVQLEREPFIGQPALRDELRRGPARRFVCLDIDWDQTEALFAEHGLPPEVPLAAWRTAVPVYSPGGAHVGQATSGAWSPTLKKNLALATVKAEHAELGHELRFELTVEYVRRLVKATVIDKPAFDPPRKKA